MFQQCDLWKKWQRGLKGLQPLGHPMTPEVWQRLFQRPRATPCKFQLAPQRQRLAWVRQPAALWGWWQERWRE